MLQEQNYYRPYQKHKRSSTFALIDHIDNQNDKLKMLINSFRDRPNRSNDSFNDCKHGGISNKSLRLQDSRGIIRKQVLPFYDNILVKKEKGGDSTLVNRLQHKGPSKLQINLNQQLLRRKSIIFQKPKNIPFTPSREAISSTKKSQFELTNLKQSRFRIKNTSHINIQREQKSQQEQFEVQSINTYLMVSHLQSIRMLEFESNPQEIFSFFESIYQLAKFSPPVSPVIKRYKNCTYYGDKPNESITYKGIIWYFKKTIYYGQMLAGKKNGLGIQIKLSDEIKVWKGKFQKGQKTGYFSIESTQLKYYGLLKNGLYHGQGHHITNNSEYKGNFCEGLKEGNGWQKFANKSEYKGEYFNNKFDGNGELKAQGYYFQGLFKYGKPDGYGFQRTEEYQYLGNFVMGVKEGRGKIKTKDGSALNGLFKNGLLIDQKQISPKSSEKMLLQKNLSKELLALNEQSEQGTIENMLNRLKEY